MADTYSFSVQAKPAEKEGVFTFLHTAEVDSVFELTSLWMEPVPYGAPQNQSIPPITIQRITAYSGGDSVAFSSGISDNASISGKISLRVLPGSVTTSGGILRDVDACFSQVSASTGNAASAFWQNNTTGRFSNRSYGNLIFSGINAVQSLTLAAGEGVAVRFSSAAVASMLTLQSVRATHRRPYNIHIRVGTSIYCAFFEVPTSVCGQEIFVVFNESGSGVTCEVLAIEQVNMGPFWTKNSTLAAYGARGNTGFSLQSVNHIECPPGSTRQAVTFESNRSSAPSLSGKLDSYVGLFIGDFNPESAETKAAMRTIAGNNTPEYDSAGQFRAWENGASFRNVKDRYLQEQSPVPLLKSGAKRPIVSAAFAPIVIRKGEGISLVCTGNTLGGADVVVFGTIRYVPAVAVYPVVGDVDTGIQYGPTGADYTGTLEQPAEADVESGVTYGAGGTEFTGTLVAGGGGNTYSRGRVTNA
jgi:hypothetical protein